MAQKAPPAAEANLDEAHQRAIESLEACEEFVQRFNVLNRHAERGRVRGVHEVRGVRMAGDSKTIDLGAEYEMLASFQDATAAVPSETLSAIRVAVTAGMPSVGFRNDYRSVDRPTAHEAIFALADLLCGIGQEALIRQKSTVEFSGEKSFVYGGADLFEELDLPEFDSVWLASQLDLEKAKAIAWRGANSTAGAPTTWRDKSFGTVNERMMSALDEDSTLIGLSKADWADLLCCGKTTIQGTDMWETIQRNRGDSRLDSIPGLRGRTDPAEPVG